jgi:DNA-binding transcriptional LysR family regulator
VRFDPTDLRLFLRVVEASSITHGATAAHLALASASARIRAMEDETGTALLVRNRRGVTPTPAGEALVHHARILLQQLERLRGELGEHARGLRGHVRLLANTAAVTEFLPERLARFLVAHPNIDVDLGETPSREIVPAVARGLADIGIAADTTGAGLLQTFPFAIDRLVLAVPRGDPLGRRTAIAFAEVAGRDFVGLDVASALQAHLAERALAVGHVMRLRVRLPDFETVCRMVGRGVGLGVVPETAARRHARACAIRAVALTDPWSLRQLSICVRGLSELPVHAQRLVAVLRDQSRALAKVE